MRPYRKEPVVLTAFNGVTIISVVSFSADVNQLIDQSIKSQWYHEPHLFWLRYDGPWPLHFYLQRMSRLVYLYVTQDCKSLRLNLRSCLILINFPPEKINCDYQIIVQFWKLKLLKFNYSVLCLFCFNRITYSGDSRKCFRFRFTGHGLHIITKQ